MSLRHAILGFLRIEPTTGYTLRQRFEGSVGSFWTATQSQIYRELHALLAEDKVEVEVVPQRGKPARRVYALTRSGRDHLDAWLREPVAPPQLRDSLLLKLVFAAEVPAEALDRMLAQHQGALEQTAAEYRARLGAREIFDLAASRREAALWMLSIENGLAWCEGQLGWCKRARQVLARTPPGAKPAGRRRRRKRGHG